MDNLRRLERLGLTADQAAVYRALLADPGADTARLARTVGTPGIDAQLDALTALQLVVADPDQPAGVLALSPAHALSRLARNRLAGLGDEMRAVVDLHADIMALEGLTTGPPSPAADATVREHLGPAAGARMQQLSHDARHGLLSATPGAGLDARRRPASLAAIINSLARGVSLSWIVQPELLADASLQPFLVEILDAGGEIRVTRHDITRVAIIDQVTALVPLYPSHPKAGALEMTHPAAVSLLIMLFEQWWSRAVPLQLVDGGARSWLEILDADDLLLLRLVSEGATDGAMARRLSVSERQVRRRIAAFMELMGARSRTRAVVLAERAGALGPDPAASTGPEAPLRTHCPVETDGIG